MTNIPTLTNLNDVDSPGPKMILGWRGQEFEARNRKGKAAKARCGEVNAKHMGRRHPGGGETKK